MPNRHKIARAAVDGSTASTRTGSETDHARTISHASPAARTDRGKAIVRGLVQASESHLADCRFRQLSPKTLALYSEYENSFLEWCATEGISLALSSLNAANTRLYAEHIRGRHGGKRGGEYAARTAVMVLKIWSHYLVDEDALEADYLARLKLPKVTKVARQAYETWEIQALRGAMADSPTSTRDVAILALLLDTGMRVGELVALRLGDIDLQGRRVRVHGKGKLDRVIPFGNAASRDGGTSVRRVRAYLDSRYVHPTLPQSERDRFLMTYNGLPLTDVGVRSVFAKAARRAGLSHQEVHACRHTFAVRYLVRNPNDVEGLRYLMGHLSQDMYRVYAGQAGQLIAEIAGRESVADAMFNEAIPFPRPRPFYSGGGTDPAASPIRGRQDEANRASARPQRVVQRPS